MRKFGLIFLIIIIAANGFNIRAQSECASGSHRYRQSSVTEPAADIDGEILYECEICGYEYSKILYATSHIWSDWIVDIRAGCTAEGHKYRTCAVGAEHIQEESIPPAGHDYRTEYTPPTCLTEGMKLHKCTECGDSYKELTDPVRSHTYHQKILLEPTDSAEGIMEYACEICGDSYTEPIPKHIHEYKKTSESPSDCENPGESVYECEICNHVKKIRINPAGHKFGEWHTVKKANFTEEGLSRCECHCGKTLEKILPKAITLEITPVTAAAASVNFGMIIFFIITIMSDVYVIRWDIKKRRELKARLRELRKQQRERGRY